MTSDGNFRNFCYNEAENLRIVRYSPSVFSNALAACKKNVITARDRIKKEERTVRVLLNVRRDKHG